MLVRVGAREARSDLGAIDRSGHRSERMVKYSDVKAREVEDFDNTGIGQKSRQIWRAQAAERIWAAGRYLHHVGRSVARRQLYHAKPVTMRIKPHRLGVDRDRAIAITGQVRQVAAMEADGHGSSVAVGRRRRISIAQKWYKIAKSRSCNSIVYNFLLIIHAFFRGGGYSL